MTKLLRVAAAGTGYFSRFHYDAWARCEDVEVVGVADLDLKAAREVADQFSAPAYSDISEMLEQTRPDLLDVITPPDTHLKMIGLAARHGVNVACQKPFCGSLENAKQALKFTDKISITVHENFRFQPWYGVLKNELPRLGETYGATFRLRPGDGQGPEAYLERQPYFQKMERFLIHETAIHFVDVFRYLFGEPRRVFAHLRRLNPAISGEDASQIQLDFGKSIAIVDANRLSDHRAEDRRRTMGEMLIEGENGVLALDGDAKITFRKHGSNELETIHFDWHDHGFGGDCVFRFTRHLVDHLIHGTPRANNAQDYLRTWKLRRSSTNLPGRNRGLIFKNSM